MTSISVIMSTARDNYPILGLPNVHMLQPTIESLKIQSFKDFEFVLVDGLYHLRSNLFSDKEKGGIFDKSKLPFSIEHIPIEHNDRFNHRFPMDNRRWNVCGSLNTGIIHAKGELIVRLDDCCEFDSEYLKKFWEGYKSGYFPQALHIRYLEGKPAYLNDEYRKKGYEFSTSINFGYKTAIENLKERDEILKKIYGENGLVRDTRYKTVKEKGGRMVASDSWSYGYASYTLGSALKVNGYDELMDFDKSLEDSDFGSRLTMAGYSNKFLLDVGLQVIEHEHGGLSNKVIDINGPNIKCNYAIYLTNRRKKRWRANSSILDKNDLEFIRQESLKPPCSPRSNFYDENCNGKWWGIWTKNQPVFDLRAERKLYGL